MLQAAVLLLGCGALCRYHWEIDTITASIVLCVAPFDGFSFSLLWQGGRHLTAVRTKHPDRASFVQLHWL